MSTHLLPDLLLHGGPIITLDPALPHADALLVRGPNIVAVGSFAAVSAAAHPGARVIDLAGRTAMPGLVDAHCHPVKGAVALLFSCRFEFSATPDDIAAAVTAALARSPDAPCIMGGRWGSGFFERYAIESPRAWLDALAPGRAVYLRDDSGHNGWASSTALDMARIGRDTPDPAGGRILRDAHGEPTGLLLEEADSIARNRLPDWSDAQYLAGVEEMVRIAHSFGITAVNDADASEPLLRAYHAADSAGTLRMRVAASISTPYGRRTAPLNCAVYADLRDRYASPHVDTRFAKIYLDGVPTSARSAAMLTPYQPHPDFPEGHTGGVHVDTDVLSQDIAAFEASGFTVKLHTAGDRSIRIALDAIEAAHELSGRNDLQHQLAHAGFIDDADLPRFRTLNVAADLSPYLWYPSPINESIVSAVGERGRCYWPIRTFTEMDVALLAGSDWPAAVASMDPWIGLATMITRRDPNGRTAGQLWPEQAIDLERALRIFTIDSARALRIEDRAGTLSPGKSADIIVLDRDLHQTPVEEIAKTRVDLTFFEGECVWERAAQGLQK